MIEERVLIELWSSFASLLRSYGAAHGLNSSHQAILEVSSDIIIVRAGNHWLQFTRHAMTRDDGSSVAFHLNEDGTVAIDQVIDEMDFAAERLMRELMS